MMLASLIAWWNSATVWWESIASGVQAAIIAALASVLVSIVAQLWSPIAQLKLERKKAELQSDLENTKTRLQKELESEKTKAQTSLEQVKSNLAKDLELTRDSIVAQNETIEILVKAKERWKASDQLAPDNATLMSRSSDALESMFSWIVAHGNTCRDIVDKIKYYIDDDRKQSIEKIGQEISAALKQFYECQSEEEVPDELVQQIILKNYEFSKAVGEAIDLEIEALVKRRSVQRG